MSLPSLPADLTNVVDGSDDVDQAVMIRYKTFADGLKDFILQGGMIYNVLHEDYGVTGDGVADDTAEIQLAIDACNSNGGGIVFFPAGTYLISSALTVYSNVVLLGSGDSSIISMPTGNYPLSICGTKTATTTTLTANAVAGSLVINVTDAGDFSADDWVLIISDAFFDSGSTTTLGEIHKIRSIVGNAITFDALLDDAYATADNACIYLLAMKENITVADLRFEGGGSAQNQYGIRVDYVHKFFMKNVSIVDFYDRDIWASNIVNFLFSGCNIRNANRASLGYGITVNDASRSGDIVDCEFAVCRHGVSFGGSLGVQRKIVVSHNRFIGGGITYAGQVGTHDTCEGIVVSGNVSDGDMFVSVDSPRIFIVGNYVTTPVQSNVSAIGLASCAKEVKVYNNDFIIRSSFGISGYTSRVDRLEVKGNHFKQGTTTVSTPYGVYLDYGYDDVEICDNTFEAFSNGIYIRNSNAGADSFNLSIHGNTVLNSTAYGISVKAGPYDNYGTLVHDNHVVTSVGVGIMIWDLNAGAGYNGNLSIKDNVIHDVATGIGIYHYTKDFDLDGNICTSTTTPILIASSTVGDGRVGQQIMALTALDLSGAATDNLVFIASSDGQIVMFEVIYTEASSADAAVGIRIGRAQDGVALDSDYYAQVDSEISQNAGYKKRHITTDLTVDDVTAGDLIYVGTVGGKTGTGEVIVKLHYAPCVE